MKNLSQLIWKLISLEADEISLEADESGSDYSDIEFSDSDTQPESSEEAVIKLGHLGCITHSLQLVINNSIKQNNDVQSFLKEVRSIMVFFIRSVKWSDKLREHTKEDILLPSETRWNGILDMLDRLAKVGFKSPFLNFKTG